MSQFHPEVIKFPWIPIGITLVSLFLFYSIGKWLVEYGIWFWKINMKKSSSSSKSSGRKRREVPPRKTRRSNKYESDEEENDDNEDYDSD